MTNGTLTTEWPNGTFKISLDSNSRPAGGGRRRQSKEIDGRKAREVTEARSQVICSIAAFVHADDRQGRLMALLAATWTLALFLGRCRTNPAGLQRGNLASSAHAPSLWTASARLNGIARCVAGLIGCRTCASERCTQAGMRPSECDEDHVKR